jgi:cupin fold WbuC family metalloprotein
VLRGKLMVRFYNEAGEVTEVFPLDPASGRYGVNIPKGQWHGLTVEESAVIFECKDGPYCPVRAEDVLRVND